eukprot:TRINITY_DN66802_c6_g1_i1.p1 TRINITY_DN66802_c6_g1~~TRINITY_DN66802_c6_g1_i1.p1  ORF type:complete len:1154 (+),score=620.96 TRINITY_DN66802_c6_g1_i1:18-3479(+)
MMTQSVSESLLFRPFRTVGMVADSVAVDVKRLGSETFATAAVGKSWQVFNLDKLRTVMVAPMAARRIAALASARDVTFTAHGDEIVVWKRNQQMNVLRGEHKSDVMRLMTFGGTEYLLSVDHDQLLCVWAVKDVKACRLVRKLSLQSGAVRREVTCIMHPHTYLNKIVVGFDSGDLELWNIRTGKRIFAFSLPAPIDERSKQQGVSGFLERERLRRAELRRRQRLTKKRDNNDSASDDDYDDDDEEEETEHGMHSDSTTAVTCVEQSPLVDVVAIGRADGSIVVHNLKYDETVTSFLQTDGPVTALSFRSDGKLPTVVSGSNHGHLSVWNLETRKLQTVLRNAHDGPVVSAHFLDQQHVLLTSGADNSLKMWIFDQADHSGRLLRQRAGHSLPPHRVRFYSNTQGTGAGMGTGNEADSASSTILSAGQDRALRVFSIIRDRNAAELSQGSLQSRASELHMTMKELRLAPAVDFDASATRERDWANVLSCHEGDAAAHCWSTKNRAKTRVFLKSKPFPTVPVTAVAISACGSFGVLGFRDGRVEKYNMQSGFFRGGFKYVKNNGDGDGDEDMKPGDSDSGDSDSGDSDRDSDSDDNNDDNNPHDDTDSLMHQKDSTDDTAAYVSGRKQALIQAKARRTRQRLKRMRPAHDAAVFGVQVDGLNRVVVSASLDGTVKLWDFAKLTLLHTIDLGSPISRMVYHRDSDLIAVTTDDLMVKVIDTSTRRVVRSFGGHRSRLSDMAFSPDGRWLVTACMDGTMRVFDLVSGRLIDWLIFNQPVTSLSFAPKSDVLATTHVNTLGIFLWANKAFFSNVYMRSVPSRPIDVDLDKSLAAHIDAERSNRLDKDSNNDDDDGSGKLLDMFSVVRFAATAAQLDEELTTLSALPKSKWQNLANLDEIKARNKPLQAPKAPEKAPFFLTTQAGLEPQLDVTEAKKQQEEKQAREEEAEKQRKSRIIQSGGKQDDSSLVQRLELASSAAQRTLKRMRAEYCEQQEAEQSKQQQRKKKQKNKKKRKNDDNNDTAATAASTRVPMTKEMWKATAEHFEGVNTFLKSLSPSALDAEINMLGLDVFREKTHLAWMMQYFLCQLSQRRDVEFVQALLGVFLKVHAEAIATHPELLRIVPELQRLQEELWRNLERLLHANQALVSFFTKTQIT